MVEVRECWGEDDMEGMWWRLGSVGERRILRGCSGYGGDVVEGREYWEDGNMRWRGGYGVGEGYRVECELEMKVLVGEER